MTDLEPVAALLQSVPDRQALVDMIVECGNEETDLRRRVTALDLPDASGLR